MSVASLLRRGTDPRLLQDAFTCELSSQHGARSQETEFDILFSLASHVTGYAGLTFDAVGQTLSWWTFYPYDTLPNTPQRTGFGTLAHVAALLAVRDRLPKDPSIHVVHESISAMNLALDREQHLEAMGIDPYRWIPIDDYLERSLEYARRRGFSFD